MTDKVSVCTSALILLGGQSISSLEDGSTGATIAKTLFDSVYKDLLTETRWHFATRTARLPKLLQKPDNGYTNKFQIPEDSLYVIKCSSNPYEIYETELYTNSEDVQIEYVFEPNLDRVPAFFIKALEYRLASEFAVPLVSDLNKADMYYKLSLDHLKKARYNDASSRTNSVIESAPYLTARF